MYPKTYSCSPEEFLRNVRIPTRIMQDEAGMMEEIAQLMYEAILAKANDGRTVLICPVGPIGQYSLLAEKINAGHTMLSHVWFINMDEYLTDDDKYTDDPNLSFRVFMEQEFFSLILPELRPAEDRCIFPDPLDPTALDMLLERLGHADLSLTGVGINGHLAFNEPPSGESGITDEDYSTLGTRILSIPQATIINNAARKFRGVLELFPRRCITIGMKQLLDCKKIKIYLYCDWQWGAMRKLSLEPPSRFCPASFLQLHSDAEMVITRDLYEFMFECTCTSW